MSDWSGFEEEVRAREKGRGPACRVGVVLEGLDPSGRAAVLAVLSGSDLTNVAIAAVLKRRLGAAAPSLWSVGNHRRGKCACPR